MRAVEFGPSARADLDQLIEASDAEFGEEQTRRYACELSNAIDLLAEMPGMGTEVAGRPELKRHRHRSHAIYYRAVRDSVLIVRILHVRQDPGRALWPTP